MRKKLREARVNNGYKDVASLSKKIGISESYYYKIEQGKRSPGVTLAKKIADELGGTVDDLFFEHELDEASKGRKKQEAI